MKQGSFRAVRHAVLLLIMLSIAVFSVHGQFVRGQQPTVDLMSIIIDRFDGSTTSEWTFGGRTFQHEFEWGVQASRFATTINNESWPRLTFVDAWPLALFGRNMENRDIRSLGLWGRFDRRGYNWIDLFPIVPGSGNDGEAPVPFEIPIPGRIRYMDMWVWGSNHNFYIEAYFRDHRGIVHSVHLGELGFEGWQNMSLRIPNHIPQTRRTLPRSAGLHFVKFRIWTTPVERVDNFFIYFNQLKILTDVFTDLYDGDDLADPERVMDLWARN